MTAARSGARRPLLFYVASVEDPQRLGLGPALAGAAERAGWEFESYYDALRKGRHFGGGDPDAAAEGWPNGGLVAGARHFDQVLWLASAFEIVACGDPSSPLWPTLQACGAEVLARSLDPVDIYAAVFERLELPLPATVLVLDGSPQGRGNVVAAPYLYPAVLEEDGALAVDVSSDELVRSGLELLGASVFRGLFVDPRRGKAFPGGLDAVEGSVDELPFDSLTAALAERHAHWGRGILLGDPALVASQLPRARRLRLIPLYGHPQTRVIARTEEIIRKAREPVFGRQYDDHDFFALARLGHGLQVVDPAPPFAAAADVPARISAPPVPLWDAEPDDGQLERWSEEGRVLATLLFWCGMVRELDCLPPIIDLVAATDLAAGLLVTADTFQVAGGSPLGLLSVPSGRGGVFGLLEPLLASTGRGVAAETLMPNGTLETSLSEARAALEAMLPPGLVPRGWWPLLDAPLVPGRTPRIGWRSGHPVLRFTPRAGDEGDPGPRPARPRRDLRALGGETVRRFGLQRLFEERRPFEHLRPGRPDAGVANAVRHAGFSYMWSKAAFGDPIVFGREGSFIALTLTAGRWEGWSPFYTVARTRDIARSERNLLRRRSGGWLVGVIDSPLFALSGELLEHGSELYRVAALVAKGGVSGRLINVTPHTVARYARLLDERGVLAPG